MNILLQTETFIPSFLSDETLVTELSTNERLVVLIGFILLFILAVYLTYRAVHEQLEFMAITKSYTDFSQSKRMAEILPLESADGHWFDGYLGVNYSLEARDLYYTTNYEYLPAWSLDALLKIIGHYTLQTVSKDKKVFIVSEGNYPICSDDYSEPIDACVAMVEKLHELNLL